MSYKFCFQKFILKTTAEIDTVEGVHASFIC